MNVEFKIEEYLKGNKSIFYSIKLKGEAKLEIDKFIEKFEISDSESIANIIDRIDIMADKTGCLDYYFKIKESSFYNNLCALSKGELRLYCLRYGNMGVILGGGGKKPAGITAYQDAPELYESVKLLENICKQIDDRIRDGEIIVGENSLLGNLNFL
ncbi:MAG: hypothetical protein K1X86_02480 [Ignavibacteria bacterium]|nr:hypothetical protein [Ignavibacteria bacterium]